VASIKRSLLVLLNLEEWKVEVEEEEEVVFTTEEDDCMLVAEEAEIDENMLLALAAEAALAVESA